MSNWFRKSQFEDRDIGFDKDSQDPVRYKVMIPVNIWITPTDDQFLDQENVYNLLKGILNTGSQSVDHQGFSDSLQLNDIQTHGNAMREFGI